MRKKYEYLVITDAKLKENISWGDGYQSMNEIGADGWELVSVTSTFENGNTYYFKREMSSQDCD